MLTRRTFLGAAAAFVASARLDPFGSTQAHAQVHDGWYVGFIPDRPHNIPFVDPDRLPAHLRRTVMRYDGRERPGTILVDTSARQLFLIRPGNRAIRYGIGVGRDGFSWSGTATVGRKARWPDWRPPASMRRRQPELPVHMEGGLDNPLGARALYLHQGGRDTLYRIHGTNEPWSIGQAMSSGCVRMLNQDALDLYEKTPVGATVRVRHGMNRDAFAALDAREEYGSLDLAQSVRGLF
ncbi:L,D-transpeptidase [Salinarimonas sp.]|uniref:L,D-transpeptidase n=1 Tax=Salinarimonas sp. TaxID=2766526 RepID=UPI00391D663F